MRKILMRFNDERSRRFCIKTTIFEDEKSGRRIVSKSSVYPEGRAHIKNIVNNTRVLSGAYPDIAICSARLAAEDEAQFEYIEGTSLESLYRKAVLANDKGKIEELFKMHARILLGCPENCCDFIMTPQFQEVLGLKEWNGNPEALKISNFDGNAGNIIYREGKPVFVDYEWVFTFPVPSELVIFYNIQDVYKHIKEFEACYPLQDAKKYLGISITDEIMDKIISSFFTYVYCETDGTSYALSKYINVKGKTNYRDYDFVVKNWKEACQANALLSQQIEAWKKKYEQEVQNHQIHAKQIEDAVQEQARQSETWRIAYETVINSRTWRLSKKLKRLIGRK